jgi:DNA-binding MarR family transcriptional regulator
VNQAPTNGREPRWLDEEEQHAWRAVLRAWHLLRIGMEEALDAFDLSFGEYELLSMLSEAPGQRMRMAALADLIVQSRSRVSHTASRLERRQWVQRTPSAQDGRGVVLTLTPAGREVLKRVAPVHVESVRRGLLDHLSRDELMTYGDLMSRVVRATRSSTDQASDAV